MPDIFVALDTSFYSNYYGKMVRAGLIYQFVLTWVDSNRAQLTKDYTNFEKFNKRFQVSDQMIEELVAAAEKQKIPRDPQGLNTSIVELRKQIKGLVAQSLFNTSQYFEITNQDNSVYQKAIEILYNWDKYKVLVFE